MTSIQIMFLNHACQVAHVENMDIVHSLSMRSVCNIHVV